LLGKQRYSIVIPGIGYISGDWFQPYAMTMFLGAVVQEATNSDLDFDWKRLFSGSFDVMVKQTILSDILNPFGISAYSGDYENFVNYLFGAAYMAMPQIVSKFNKAVDPYKRDVYGGDFWEDLKNRFLMNVPFGSFAIPPKVDIFGNQIKSVKAEGVTGLAERTFINLMTPVLFSPDRSDVVSIEINKLYEKTKDGNAVPPLPEAHFTYGEKGKKTKYILTSDEYLWYLKEIGQAEYQQLYQLFTSPSYMQMTDEQKIKEIQRIYEKAKKEAQYRYVFYQRRIKR